MTQGENPIDNFRGPIWGWHSGRQELVCIPLDANNRPGIFPLQVLKSLRTDDGKPWNVDEEGLRKALPRVDAPTIAIGGTAQQIAEAAAKANAANRVDRGLRGR